MEKKEYYVYAHYVDGESIPFYIGKGKDKRAYDVKRRSAFWNRVAKKGYRVELIAEGLTEKQALAIETEQIKKFGRRDKGTGCLVNMTDGGDGLTSPSELTRKKIGDANTKRFTDPEFRKRFSVAQRNKPTVTEETKKKMSIGQSKRYSNREERNKMKITSELAWTEEKRKEQSERKLEFYKDRLDVKNKISDTMKKLKCKKSYTLISPDGKEYECLYQTEFAKTHNLNGSALNSLLRNRRKSHKGWKLKTEGNTNGSEEENEES
jgi:hypothetical protein